MEKVGNWANKIVTHFWFCCEKCNENVEDLKVKLTFIIYLLFYKSMCPYLQTKWIGLLHHISGEHERETGECDHEQLDEQEEHLPYFDKHGKDFEAVQKIVLDKQWIESLRHYVRFR